jgi:putative Mg2+ transporter-C (MgtC) family protein
VGFGDLLLQLAAAALLGSLIGLERQRHDHAAGLRTHMLVSVGAALFMIVSAHGFDRVIQPGRIELDPSRVAAQVVSGIGFLGAGTIVVRKMSVHGLTTAASIWAVAAIGLAAGGTLYLAAIAATTMILVILAVIKPLEDRLLGHGHVERRTVKLTVDRGFDVGTLEAPLRRAGVELIGVRVREGESQGSRLIDVTYGPASAATALRLLGELQALDGVREAGSE